MDCMRVGTFEKVDLGIIVIPDSKCHIAPRKEMLYTSYKIGHALTGNLTGPYH